MAPFNSFSPDALRFLAELKANNTKEWFVENRRPYEVNLKDPGRQFAAEMAEALGDLTGQIHSSKIFRINRDL
ncbi:MAG: DUF2461 family protein, partial [Pseudomonadota bacterium]